MFGINAEYALLQGSEWAVDSCLYCFSSVFLLSCGLSNTTIGIVLAIATGLSFIFQLLFGEIINSRGEKGLKCFLLLSSLVLLANNISILSGASKGLSIVLFLLNCLILQTLPAFMNSTAMFEVKSGIPVNYGIGRGCGSLGYALFAFIAGRAVLSRGIKSIFLIGTITNVILILTVFLFFRSVKKYRQEKCIEINADYKQSTDKSIIQFIRSYPSFIATLFGIVLLMTGHTYISNFIYQIVSFKGGNAANTGAASSIAACFEIPVLFLFTRIKKNTSSRKWMLIACVIMTVRLVSAYLAPNLKAFQLTQSLQIGYGLFAASSVYYTGDVIRLEDSIKSQAFLNSASTVGVLLSLFTGGRLIDRYSVSTLLIVGAALLAIGTAIVAYASSDKRS